MCTTFEHHPAHNSVATLFKKWLSSFSRARVCEIFHGARQPPTQQPYPNQPSSHPAIQPPLRLGPPFTLVITRIIVGLCAHGPGSVLVASLSPLGGKGTKVGFIFMLFHRLTLVSYISFLIGFRCALSALMSTLLSCPLPDPDSQNRSRS